MRKAVVRRLFMSLHIQLFLWAIMPVTFVLIGLSFAGVYAHQQTMRDFVINRDACVASLLAEIAEDGLAHGVIGVDGREAATWMALEAQELPGAALVVNREGKVLAHSIPEQVGTNVRDAPGVARALEQRQGSTIVEDQAGPLLVTYVPIDGTDWVVLVQEPVRRLTGPLLQFPRLAPVVAAGAGILSIFILTFGWLTIVRPLQRLSHSAEQVAWGKYAALDSHVLTRSVHGVQEIRDLRQAIVEMVERIRGYEAGMHDYMSALTRGQEAERARLARELHDGPVQEIIAIGQRAEMAQRLLYRNQTEHAQTLLEELRRTGQQTVQELRCLMSALRPIYLEDLGFVPALEMLAREAAQRSGVHVQLEQGQQMYRLAPEVELAAYRIAQEALNNALQHAQAQHISIDIRCEGQMLTLAIADDGVGFVVPEHPSMLTGEGHFGLIGMRERAFQLGGALHVHTARGHGTCIVAQVPVQPDGVNRLDPWPHQMAETTAHS